MPTGDRPQKRIEVGCRVSGSFGEFIPNPNPAIKRRHRAKLYGVVTEACGRNRYKDLCDNGTEHEVASNSLRIEKQTASLPPDLLRDLVNRDETVAQSVLGDASIADQDSEDSSVGDDVSQVSDESETPALNEEHEPAAEPAAETTQDIQEEREDNFQGFILDANEVVKLPTCQADSSS